MVEETLPGPDTNSTALVANTTSPGPLRHRTGRVAGLAAEPAACKGFLREDIAVGRRRL